MLDWCNVLESKLSELGIIEGNPEHFYGPLPSVPAARSNLASSNGAQSHNSTLTQGGTSSAVSHTNSFINTASARQQNMQNERRTSRQLFPENGQGNHGNSGAGDQSSQATAADGSSLDQGAAENSFVTEPEIQLPRRVYRRTDSEPVMRRRSSADAPPPLIPRRNSRPLTIVQGQAVTPDGPSTQGGPVISSPRSPVTPPGRPPMTRSQSVQHSSIHLRTPPLTPQSPVSQLGFFAASGAPSALSRRHSAPHSPSSPPAYLASPISLSPFPLDPLSEAGASSLDSDLSNPSSPIVLPPKMMEALGLSEDPICGWSAPPPEGDDAPPPYARRGTLNYGTDKALKQSQVEQLQTEMAHAGGVKIILRRTDCHHTIIFADAFNAVWVAGWNQKARPFLHNAFHIGDQIISVNGQVIENARMVRKLIKYSGDEDKVYFILKRVPKAKVFAIKREEDGQSLGLRRAGGTGEIVDIDPYGLAALHGVPVKAPSLDGTNLCHWFLTEVNSRPVNLFFKENEIEKRLNAVGKDISIMVQPIELIQELKRQLKLIKNYKDFIVQ